MTELLLVKNPKLLEHVAAALLTLPDMYPVDIWARRGYDVTARKLAARRKKA